jgi:hypothetical protein
VWTDAGRREKSEGCAGCLLVRRRDERAVDRLEGACVCRVCEDVVGWCEGAVVAESGAVRGGVRPLAVLRCVLR